MRFDDASRFATRAGPWLLRSEAEHNLLLGLSRQLQGNDHPFEDPIYLATVESDGEVVGCAFRTPPFKLGLTRMPLEAIPLLAADLAATFESLPAVFGPEAECNTFAESWAELRPVVTDPGMRARIYVLEELTPPPQAASGKFVIASDEDFPLVVEWMFSFHVDARMSPEGSDRMARSAVAKRGIALWLDPEPRSMAGVTGATPNGIRVGYVYTPPEHRGKGYASSCVAELSRRQFAAGKKFCFLYTDLANPTSNSIYRRLGYRPVCDVVDVIFGFRK